MHGPIWKVIFYDLSSLLLSVQTYNLCEFHSSTRLLSSFNLLRAVSRSITHYLGFSFMFLINIIPVEYPLFANFLKCCK